MNLQERNLDFFNFKFFKVQIIDKYCFVVRSVFRPIVMLKSENSTEEKAKIGTKFQKLNNINAKKGGGLWRELWMSFAFSFPNSWKCIPNNHIIYGNGKTTHS